MFTHEGASHVSIDNPPVPYHPVCPPFSRHRLQRRGGPRRAGKRIRPGRHGSPTTRLPCRVQDLAALAENGNVDAQYNIARMLQDGDGAAKNPSEAAAWFRKAAEQGDKESQYYLGLMYLRGEGVAANEAEAHKWFAMNRQSHCASGEFTQSPVANRPEILTVQPIASK